METIKIRDIWEVAQAIVEKNLLRVQWDIRGVLGKTES